METLSPSYNWRTWFQRVKMTIQLKAEAEEHRPPSLTKQTSLLHTAKRTAEHRSFRDRMDHRSSQISLRPPFQPTCPTPHPQLNQSKSDRNNVTLLFFMELLISNEMAKKKKKSEKETEHRIQEIWKVTNQPQCHWELTLAYVLGAELHHPPKSQRTRAKLASSTW